MKDLLIIVADKDAEALMNALLSRISKIEDLKDFTFEVKRHPENDAGVHNHVHTYTRYFRNNYQYLLVIYDYEFSLTDDNKKLKPKDLEDEVTNRLQSIGWNDNCFVKVVYPEIEQWIWVNEVKFKESIGNKWIHELNIYEWLKVNQFQFIDHHKPMRPKEALDAILREVKVPHSSALFKNLATVASYQNCTDNAFKTMIECLKKWFKK